MEISEVKDWLNRGHKINREMEHLNMSVANLRSRAVSITTNYGGNTVAGTKDPHKMDSDLAAVERYAEIVRDRIAELSEVSGEITRVIRQVKDNRERAVLIDRYLNFFSWEQIAVSMDYTYRNVIYIHGAALKSVKAILEESFP